MSDMTSTDIAPAICSLFAHSTSSGATLASCFGAAWSVTLLVGLAASLAGCATTGDTDRRVGSARSSLDAGAERERWHTTRLSSLAAPDGWLTLVGLDFLTDGTHRIGSGEDCAFRYTNLTAPVVGMFIVQGANVRFRSASDGILLDGQPLAGEASLVADDAGTPSVIRNGSVSITLVRRNGALALRVRDNASPVRTG
ncbi:MAG: hypothetical protein ACKO3W_07100, partial [bacterium]